MPRLRRRNRESTSVAPRTANGPRRGQRGYRPTVLDVGRWLSKAQSNFCPFSWCDYSPRIRRASGGRGNKNCHACVGGTVSQRQWHPEQPSAHVEDSGAIAPLSSTWADGCPKHNRTSVPSLGATTHPESAVRLVGGRGNTRQLHMGHHALDYSCCRWTCKTLGFSGCLSR